MDSSSSLAGPVTPAPADTNLGLLLFVSYRAMEQRVFKAIAHAGFADVTLAQARIFQRIGPGGTRLTDLAGQSQVTKQTAGFLVDQLERAGYVRRTPDPKDARARLIRISDRGAAAQSIAVQVVDQVEREWAAHLGRKQWTALRSALVSLREVTDPYQ